jgi:hypothetical protein
LLQREVFPNLNKEHVFLFNQRVSHFIVVERRTKQEDLRHDWEEQSNQQLDRVVVILSVECADQ